MKLRLLSIGATRQSSLQGVMADYAARISHYWPFTSGELPDVKLPKNVSDPERQKILEGQRFLAEIDKADYVVLLDERGVELTSRQFSEFIRRQSVQLPRNMVFVIGGPYGFSKDMYQRANKLMSLSKMTFPHDLVRVFVLEQIYRAGTISRGEPYHHD